MKIGLIRHAMDEPQGGARQVALLARDLRELGEDVTIYCYRHDATRCFPDTLANVSIWAVERTVRGGRARPEDGWRRTAAQLRRYFVEAPAVASLIAPDTEILNPHEWLAHKAAALFARRHRVPVVWSYNDPSGWHVVRNRGLGRVPSRVFGWFDTRLVNRFTALTTLDRRMREIAEAAFTPPVHIVRSGVDARTLVQDGTVARRPGTRERLSLLSVGILFPHRRFEDAIRAVYLARQQNVDCRYDVVGSDRFSPDYGASLRQLVSELDLDAFISLRFDAVSEAELDTAYRRADALIFPNEQQTWGLAVLEAMARGVPVIVSRGAGVHEVLADNENALLVDPRRPEEIAAAIIRLGQDSGLKPALAESGRRLVRESYTSRHYAEQMLRLFQECLVRPHAD